MTTPALRHMRTGGKRRMTLKIYLSPSKQTANLYAAGNTNEQTQCNLIAAAAEKALLRCGFEVKKAPEGQEIEESVRQSNAWGADLHLPIHTNAGGGRGCVVFISLRSDDRLAIALPIYEEIDAITLYRSVYGVREKQFYEIRNSNAICAYVECEFHDDPELARWIVANTGALGEAICRGVCRAFGVEYVIEGSEDEMVRWNSLEAMPSGYREMAQRYVEAGALKGKNDGGLDLSEDMLRVMEIMRRYFEGEE